MANMLKKIRERKAETAGRRVPRKRLGTRGEKKGPRATPALKSMGGRVAAGNPRP